MKIINLSQGKRAIQLATPHQETVTGDELVAAFIRSGTFANRVAIEAEVEDILTRLAQG